MTYQSRLFSTLFFAALLALTGCSESGPTAPADADPPQLITVTVNAGGTTATAVFSEALDPASVTPGGFTVVPGPVTVASATLTGASNVLLAFAQPLDGSAEATYTVIASGVRDAAGNAAAGAQGTFRFGSTDGDGNGGGGPTSPAIGAAYPNVGDNRIILVNTDGDRYVYWNPATGSFSRARDIDDLEVGGIPLDDIGASATTYDDSETYYFATDGSTYSIYERETSEFDEAHDFEDDGDFGEPEIEDVGAAMVLGQSGNPNRLYLFNGAGTRFGIWDYANERWNGFYNFPANFGTGQAPIAAVGAAFYMEAENAYYLFDRDGQAYTIWTSNNRFTAAFDISQLGDGSLSFD